MKKQKILLIIFILSQSFYAQNLKGIIRYNVEINKTIIDYDKISKGVNDKVMTKYLVNLFEKQQAKIYSLYFNNEESYFKKEASLQNEGDKIDLVAQHAGKGKFYFNMKTKEILEQKGFEDKKYLIKRPSTKWFLTKESKQIGKYLCYKATTNKIIETRKGPGTRKVTAWYTTQIPISFGPNEFNGLPGLILELEEGVILFKVININLKPKKEIKIKKPTKGQKVTLEEYHLIVRNAASNIKYLFGKQ